MMLAKDEEPIIAQCTPHGSGAIALLRISGINAVQVVDQFVRLSSKKSLACQVTHTIHHGFVCNSGDEIIDEVLFFLMKAPRTFTGQDSIEISCHNNPYIIEAIINRALEHGIRLAQPGEFSKRAFLAGKIDLMQAESINELVHAASHYTLRKSLAQLRGSLSSCIQELEQKLVDVLSLSEASFEFLDEEQRDLDFDVLVWQQLRSIKKNLESLMSGFSQQQQLRDGVRIALVGAVNVGKSTLFNVFVGKDRAIVTRQTADTIEHQGIERSWQEAKKADVVLLVSDASQPMSQAICELYRQLYDVFDGKVIWVVNKIDQVDDRALAQLKALYEQVSSKVQGKSELLMISAQERHGLKQLESKIEEKIQEKFCNFDSPYLLNRRQYALLKKLDTKMEQIIQMLGDSVHYELLCYHLKDILKDFTELSGKTIDDLVMNKVFSSFCVGK
jgi:tRNA modification GTPase